MKITEISRLESYGNHSNISITAKPHEWETPDQVFDRLGEEIQRQIDRVHTAPKLERDLEWYQSRKDQLEKDIEELRNKWELMKTWLAKFNIPIAAFGDFDESDIPF